MDFELLYTPTMPELSKEVSEKLSMSPRLSIRLGVGGVKSLRIGAARCEVARQCFTGDFGGAESGTFSGTGG